MPSSLSIRRFIRWLVPSLNPPCHGSREEEGQGAQVEPPKKKKTRSQKEAERAAMAARAIDDQAAGRGRRL
jgi:hypothetical protein